MINVLKNAWKYAGISFFLTICWFVYTQPKTSDSPQTPQTKQLSSKAAPPKKTKAQSKTQTKAQAKAQSKPQTKPQTKAKTEAQSKAKTKPQTKPQAKPKTKAQAKAQSKTQTKPQTKTQAKTPSKTQTKTPSKIQPLNENLNKKKPKQKPKKKTKTTAKDEVLEELQLFNQGFDTKHLDSSQKTPLQKAVSSRQPPTKNQPELNTQQENQQTSKTSKEPPQVKEEPLQPNPSQPSASKKTPDIDSKIDSLQKQKTAVFKMGPARAQFIQLASQYKKLIQTYPEQPKAHWELFHLLNDYIEWTKDTDFYDTNFNQQALAVLNGIQIKFGEDKQTILYLCEYLIVNHFYNEGLIQCSKSIRLNPQETKPYLLQFAHSSDSKNKKRLLKILKKFPKSPSVLVFVGRFFHSQNKHDLSIRYFKKAIETDPDFISGIRALASALFHKGRHSQALSYYSTACQKNYLKSITAFRKAKSLLSQKNLFKLANDYQNQINLCLNSKL